MARSSRSDVEPRRHQTVTGPDPLFSLIVPVGPGEREPDDARDVLQSARRHCPGTAPHVVLIDDSPARRGLEAIWPGATVVRTGLWDVSPPDPLSAMVAGTLEGLRHARGEFALKLDTDAFVVAPFHDAIRSAFRQDPTLGIVGAYDRSPSGGTRDWALWERPLRRTTRPVQVTPATPARGRRLRWVPRDRRASARATLDAALRNDAYRLGAHCLGGAYAVSPRLFERARAWDPAPWLRSGLGEDVVLGLLCAASGLRMRSMVDAGEPFAVTWRGLHAPADQILREGYSILHSVRCAERSEEDALRSHLRTVGMREG